MFRLLIQLPYLLDQVLLRIITLDRLALGTLFRLLGGARLVDRGAAQGAFGI